MPYDDPPAQCALSLIGELRRKEPILPPNFQEPNRWFSAYFPVDFGLGRTPSLDDSGQANRYFIVVFQRNIPEKWKIQQSFGSEIRIISREFLWRWIGFDASFLRGISAGTMPWPLPAAPSGHSGLCNGENSLSIRAIFVTPR